MILVDGIIIYIWLESSPLLDRGNCIDIHYCLKMGRRLLKMVPKRSQRFSRTYCVPHRLKLRGCKVAVWTTNDFLPFLKIIYFRLQTLMACIFAASLFTEMCNTFHAAFKTPYMLTCSQGPSWKILFYLISLWRYCVWS